METRSFRTHVDLEPLRQIIGSLRRQCRVRGWIRDRESYRDGCIQLMSRYANAARDAIQPAEWALGPHSDHYLFRDFAVLESRPDGFVEVAGRSARVGENVAFAHFENPDTRGRLVGRFAPMRDLRETPIVTVEIDGKVVGQQKADAFRRDLLVGGHPTGIGGFVFSLPKEVLDGHLHEVKINSDLDCELIGRHYGQVNIPFDYRGKKPWSVAGERLLLVRHQVMREGLDNSRNQLHAILDENPDSVFTDFGLDELAAERGTAVPTFREILGERAGLWHSSVSCGAEDCCKRQGLQLKIMHANALAHFGTAKPAAVRQQCKYWPKYFASKLFTKKYAASLGIKTPLTIAVVSSLEGTSRSDFPKRCVIKPEASSGVRVFLMHGDLNLYDGRFTPWPTVLTRINSDSQVKELIVIEEFLTQEGCTEADPVAPLDYKMHASGGKVRVIQVNDKNNLSRDPRRWLQGWFARDWTPSPMRFRQAEPEYYGFRKPEKLDEMLEIGDEIARDIGDYIRVDVYLSDKGIVLGEVTTTSNNGIGFTEFGDLVLRQLCELDPGPMSTECPEWK